MNKMKILMKNFGDMNIIDMAYAIIKELMFQEMIIYIILIKL